MKQVLQSHESPNRRYEVNLEKKTSIFNIVGGQFHDRFYLVIRDRRSLLGKLSPKKRRIAHNDYDPVLTPDGGGSPLGGTIVQNISIIPREEYIEVVLLILNENRDIKYEEHKTKKIDYSGKIYR